ncbi:box C/D snoRNA protein 1-like [Iris pallida]|uniref:Box C/D snoRNA protein 1 n=1 Tax=Iris pallida TaxID=29817 RepID=A0AAX6GPH2_IRIPA|nr:box C/D snoRNA protein 1-like [Iris pallida]
MEDQENIPNSNPNPRISFLCDECGLNPWKYRCPGCPVKSCSLPCVKSHKHRTGCTGKRNRTEFVPLSDFNDNLLISDYNLLEETKRVAESARRMAASIDGFRGYVGFRLPIKLQKLRNAANSRKTRLILLPPGMAKRETNRSRYDPRKKSIFWTIEWRFHATNIVLVDHGIDEHMSFSSVIEKHLAPSPLKNQLSPYRNVRLDELKFFLRKNPKGLKSPFRELDIKAPIGKQLEDVLILEYPVIFVFLPTHSHDFEVEKFTKPSSKNKEPPVSFDSVPSPKGTLFMEEEIEEGELPSETLVTDFADHVSSVPSVAEVDHDPNMRIPNTVVEDLEPISNQKTGASMLEEAKMFSLCPVNSVTTVPHYNAQIPQGNEIAAEVFHASDVQIPGAVAEGLRPVGSQICGASLLEEADIFLNDTVIAMESSEDAKSDFQQELRDVYSELLGEMNPDDFLCFDGDCGELDSLQLFWGEEELEEGEIPSQ